MTVPTANNGTHINQVGGKRSSFLPTFVFQPLTPLRSLDDFGFLQIPSHGGHPGVEHKSLSHNKLAIFRVVVSLTLKMANLLIVCYLRITARLTQGKRLRFDKNVKWCLCGNVSVILTQVPPLMKSCVMSPMGAERFFLLLSFSNLSHRCTPSMTSASFRFRLTADTLASGCNLPTIRAV